MKKSKAFWDYFESNYWPDVQKMYLDAFEKFFGKHEKYFAIDGGKFPPKALVLGNREDTAYAISAGLKERRINQDYIFLMVRGSFMELKVKLETMLQALDSCDDMEEYGWYISVETGEIFVLWVS